MTATFTIGQLAQRTGTKAETIRYYEKIGLLAAPLRSEGNYRHYAGTDAQRLGFVRRARELGFSIEQVRALLELAAHREDACASVDAAVQVHLDDIARKVRDLQALQGELEHMIGACPGGRIADCRVLEALTPDTAAARAG
ncbi:helix-turn-helix domain-containing protein [Pseudoxanthomonas sp.]|uniref:MerR family transcriptional regulator n=1 Tax=Pseudoxanthomonas sp. TaxID=1871049 RepID=UPI0026028B2B|nr:helix-turn-helix domain-containing protein [Pseudoxanthomonas sp.]WDS38000.1 MAG: helix-turn-helix domain-containing protein [Pseudoxanthomonas sp.]